MPRRRRVACGPAPALLSRREFLALTAAGAAEACGGGSSTPASPSPAVTGRLSARPQAQRTTLPAGAFQLGRDVGRDDGIIYVPHGVDPAQALPFAVMMHGSGGTSLRMEFTLPLAEEYRVVLLLPNSRHLVWDAVAGSFGADATYALALGLLNGDLFTRIVAFSPGFLKPVDRHGRPRVFVSHGTRDTVLSINVGSRAIVRQLTEEGSEVTYREFDGGHEVPDAVAREAFAWLS
jgi:enterochelin esterase-like enzyme